VIGFLSTYHLVGVQSLLAAFRRGLREAGYVEGRNVTIEYRWAENQYDRLPLLADDLVKRGVAVIVTSGGEISARAAQTATKMVPIVFNCNTDPVQLRLVASYNRPGGNATGVSLLTTAELMGKRLQLLRMLIPKVERFGLLINAKSFSGEADRRAAEAAAQVSGQQIVVRSVAPEVGLERVYADLVQQRIGGLIVQSDPLFFNLRSDLVALATLHAVPAIYGRREIVASGGLISYGSDLAEAYRQQGVYAGRILKGEKPADLPVVQSDKFELIINLKTAKALGLEVPERFLIIADDVVE
jgi:putative ABC transport system substrate-binding protein